MKEDTKKILRHKEVSSVAFRKILMGASPLFRNKEEVFREAHQKGYAVFLVHLLSVYLADLFDSVKRQTDKMDYNLAWIDGAEYYIALLGIEPTLIRRLLDEYVEFLRKVDMGEISLEDIYGDLETTEEDDE